MALPGLGRSAGLALLNPSDSSGEVDGSNARVKVEKYGFGPGRTFEHKQTRIVADGERVEVEMR